MDLRRPDIFRLRNPSLESKMPPLFFPDASTFFPLVLLLEKKKKTVDRIESEISKGALILRYPPEETGRHCNVNS